MKDHLDFIVALHRENTDALGFIPAPTIRDRYLRTGRFVVQSDERGRSVGYVLHGCPKPSRVLTIAQACVDADVRLRGYGEAAVREVIRRANAVAAPAVVLRCADPEALAFWRALGFRVVAERPPLNRRRRTVPVLRLDLWPTLFVDRRKPAEPDAGREVTP